MQGLSALGRSPRRTALLLAGATAYLVGLVALVVLPLGDWLGRLTVRLYVVWTYDLRLPGHVLPGDFGFALNIVLFVPMGALVTWQTRRPLLSTVLCVAVSSAIELVQLVPQLHRDSSLLDVLANGLGGLGGAVAAWSTSRSRHAAGDPR